jgi:hypothetical protein
MGYKALTNQLQTKYKAVTRQLQGKNQPLQGFTRLYAPKVFFESFDPVFSPSAVWCPPFRVSAPGKHAKAWTPNAGYVPK